ncbi:MAG: hypothetical protein K6A82_00455 [Prevotella sp.]|nr:hypothetical protein [Prevotella sp.]
MKQTYIAPVAEIVSVRMESHILDLSFSKEERNADQIVTVDDNDNLEAPAKAAVVPVQGIWDDDRSGWDRY